MKNFSKTLLIFIVVVLSGCSKEEQPVAPAPTPEPPVLKQEIRTLHKAEGLDQAAQDAAMEQHKQIEAATQ